VLVVLPLPPPKRVEKKGAAFCVGVLPERCMSHAI
jgi:hypothetical protein